MTGAAGHLIAFDADDTLWHSHGRFEQANTRIASVLGMSDAEVSKAVDELERRNVAVYGYGPQGYALSLVEFLAASASDTQLRSGLREVVSVCHMLHDEDVNLIDEEGLFGTLEAARSEGFLTACITKGNHRVQTSRLRSSGLMDRFDFVGVVHEKDEPTYRGLLEDWRIPADGVVMVGNSVLSDVLPVLNIGGVALHIPYVSTWALELAEKPVSGRLLEFASLSELADELRSGRLSLAGLLAR